MMTPERIMKMKPLVSNIETRISNFYKSDEYRRRLKQIGFTDAEIEARVKQLNENMANSVIEFTPSKKSGVTNIIDYPGQAHIMLNDNLSNDELSDAVLEELLHSSTFNGQNSQDMVKYKQQLIQIYGSLENAIKYRPKLKHVLSLETQKIIKNLNNDLVEKGNKLHDITVKSESVLQDLYTPEQIEQLKTNPKMYQEIINQIKSYYNNQDEKRVRGIARVMEETEKNDKFQIPLKLSEHDKMSGLANEAVKYYYNAPNYLKYVTGLSAPLMIKNTNEK